MSKTIVIIICAFLSTGVFAQQKQWVFFTDKPDAQLDSALAAEVLSAAAMARRAEQNIAIHQSDFPVSEEYINALRNENITILQTSKWLNAVSVLATDAQLESIKSKPFVKEIRTVNSMQRTHVADDFLSRAAAKNTTVPYAYGPSGTQIIMMRGDYLHDENSRGQGIKIAVLDGGFTGVNGLSPFDSLWAQNGILATYDFTDGDADVFHNGFHGMNVLSVLAGNVESQLIGSAPRAEYFLLKSEDQSSETPIEEDNWVAAMEFADSAGAKIITSSLGYTTFDGGIGNIPKSALDGRTATTSKAAAMAARKGILVVNSAGNEGQNSWGTIITPADADSILAVGGVDASRTYVDFSSPGPTADGRIKPDVAAMAAGVSLSSSTGSVITGNGTSFAAPLVSGLSACLWQRHPQATNMQIREAILQSAHLYNNPNNQLGYGIPDFYLADFFLSNPQDTFNPEDNLILMPNPYDQELTLFLRVDSYPVEVNIRVADASGNLVGEKNIQIESRLTPLEDYNNLPGGVYFFTVTQSGVSHTLKVIRL